MSRLEALLIAACLVLIVLPPRYDPAIRLKEWLERQRGENDRG
jgi:hypothetical protein